MPAERVDHAPLTEDRERDLRLELPFGQGDEPRRGEFVKRRMSGADKAAEIAAPPSDDEVDVRVERGGNRAHVGKTDAAKVAALDSADQMPRRSRGDPDLGLGQAPADSDRPKRPTHANVIHLGTMARGPHPALTGTGGV